MSYMKFCERCGNTNTYQMPYCTHCGYQLAMGNTLDYPQAKKNFQAYMDTHLNEQVEFDDNHFQICPNCHRKCPLNMDFCGWCGSKLDKIDQYKNYRMLMTTANTLTGFTLKTIKVIYYSINSANYPDNPLSQLISKANDSLRSECKEDKGNTVIGYHLLINNDGSITVYGTAVSRSPINTRSNPTPNNNLPTQM